MGEYFFLFLTFQSGFFTCLRHPSWLILGGLVFIRAFSLKKWRQISYLMLLFCLGCFVGIFQMQKKEAPLKNSTILTFSPGDFKQQENYFSGIGKNQQRQNIRVLMKDFPFYVQESEKLILKGKTIEIPFKQAMNTNGFSEEDYYQQQGIFRQVEVVKVDNFKQEKTWLTPFYEFKNKLLTNMSLWPQALKSFYQGIFFREKDEYFYQEELNYQRSGLFTLFFFSGLQFYVLLEIFSYLLLRSGVTHETSRVMKLVLGGFILVLTGFPLSFLRIYLWQLLRILPSRFFSPLDKWSLVVFLTQLFYPSQFFTFSGQIIYLATFLYLVPLSPQKKYQQLGIPFLIAPLFWWHFFEWSPIVLFTFPLLKKYYVKVFSMLLILYPMLFFSSFLQILGTKFLTTFLELFPKFYWVVGRPPIFLFILYYLVAIWAFSRSFFHLSKKKMAIFVSSFFLLAFWSNLSPFGEVTFVNVGQGDSILLKSPFQKEVILIDVGGRIPFGKKKGRSNASQTLIPYLKSRGIKKIQRLIFSHGDYDHMGDTLEVAKHFPIQKVLFQKGSEEKELVKRTLYELFPTTELISPKEQEKLPFGKGQLLFLGPEKGQGTNDESLQYLLQLGKKKFLFTGDIEENGEEKFIKSYPNLKVDILKIAHHGSKTSTTKNYLQSLQPKIGILSRGESNQFGHPHEEVLENLQEAQVKVFDTAEKGTISFPFIKEKFFPMKLFKERTKNDRMEKR